MLKIKLARRSHIKKKPRQFTQQEIVEMFGIHRQTLYNWRKAGLIKYTKVNQRLFLYELPTHRKTFKELEIRTVRVKMDLNSKYKRWHKPNMGDNAKTKQGYYKITNVSKYVGDPALCIYRSSWEFAFMKHCDFSPSIVRWSAEPIQIPYYARATKLDEKIKLGLDPNNPANWEVKRYNIDFWLEQEKPSGEIEKIFVEIKPAYKLKKPVPPKEGSPLREIKSFNNRAKEYLDNEAKFAACKAWAEKNNSKFYVFTEDTLKNILGRFGPKPSDTYA